MSRLSQVMLRSGFLVVSCFRVGSCDPNVAELSVISNPFHSTVFTCQPAILICFAYENAAHYIRHSRRRFTAFCWLLVGRALDRVEELCSMCI